MKSTQVETIKSLFKNVGEIPQKEGLYWDCNYFSTAERRCVVDKTNTDIGKDSDSGLKVRVWDGEKFLEYATTSLDKESLVEEVSSLTQQALKNREEIEKPQDLDVETDILEKDFVPEKEVSFAALEDLTTVLKEVRDKLFAVSEDVANVRAALIEEMENHIFVNNHKSLYQSIPVFISVQIVFVKCDDGNVRNVYASYVDNTGEKALHKLSSDVENFKKKIDQVKKAKKLEGGKYKVLLSPKLTGLLAHESFGHGMEADTMMKDRALASSWVGKKIGADFVQIVDYPAVEAKNGTFYFDHEGNIAHKTYLVKKGIINQPMADTYSKTKLGLSHSSNARFESFDHKHYTRMSNTYFEPGESSVEEMISKIDDGIFITDSSGGMEDPKGWGVQIQGNFGQRIKNGKLVDEFYDGFTLTGFLPDIVKNISGISKEFEIEGGGRCGKGHKEWVRVSEGGPYMLIDEVILG